MNDDLRERLATLGQLIVAAEFERSNAVASIHAIIRDHGHEMALTQVAELTTLSLPTLDAMLPDIQRRLLRRTT